jgi:F-type H+-transporting ATPase subunit c
MDMTRQAGGRRQPRREAFSIQRSAFLQTFSVFSEEAWVVSKRSVLTLAVMVVAGASTSVFAQPVIPAAAYPDMVRWSIITAGFALGIGAGLAALGQGRAVAAAAEGIARNPGAAGDIRGVLLLGLVLIESLAIYVFVISLILLFLQPFA